MSGASFGLGGFGVGATAFGKGGGSVLIPANNVVALVGDSRSASSETNSATARYLNIAGIEAWLNPLIGNRITFLPMLGEANGTAIGGSTSGDFRTMDMTSRKAAALASGAKTLLMLIGTNGGPYTVDQQMVFIEAYIADAEAAGVNVVLCNEVPNGNEGMAYHLGLHARLSALAGSRPNLVVVDTWSGMLEPGSNNTQRTGYSYDGLHQEVPGCIALANILADGYFRAAFKGFAPVAELAADGANARNVNPLLAGTAGTISAGGAMVTGQVPTNYTLSGVNATGLVVASSVAAGDGGQKLTIVLSGTPTSANPSFSVTQSLGQSRPAFLAEAVPGKKYILTAKVKVAAGAALRTVRPQVFFTKTGGAPASQTMATMWNAAGRAGQVVPADGFDLTLTTPPLEIPAGWTGGLNTASISVAFGPKQDEPISATVEISRIGLIEVA